MVYVCVKPDFKGSPFGCTEVCRKYIKILIATKADSNLSHSRNIILNFFEGSDFLNSHFAGFFNTYSTDEGENSVHRTIKVIFYICKKVLFLIQYICEIKMVNENIRDLWCEFAAPRLLGLWFQIPPGPRMPVSCECWVLSGRGFCVGQITRPEESYLSCCV